MVKDFEYISIPRTHPCWGILTKLGAGRFVYVPKEWSSRLTWEEMRVLRLYGLAGRQVYVCKRKYFDKNGRNDAQSI